MLRLKLRSVDNSRSIATTWTVSCGAPKGRSWLNERRDQKSKSAPNCKQETQPNAVRQPRYRSLRKQSEQLPGLIGLSASLIGIGGGILSNMIMTFHGRAIHESVATSAGVGVMVSIPGALGYMAAGWDRMGLPPFSAGFVSIAAV